MKRLPAIVWMLLLLVSPVFAAHDHLEKEYQEVWCAKAGGVTEVVLNDNARVDCETDEYAIEFDFASKWAESIGQALYYGIKTGKKPGVVLIEEKKDQRFRDRLKIVSNKYKIHVWIMTPDELDN
jgi:hypothetical protein